MFAKTFKAVTFLTISLILFIETNASFAQESRTVNGVVLGDSAWQPIDINESDFRGSAFSNFKISRKKLPDRVQEGWRDPRNQSDGPQVTMFYERLYTSYFTDTVFDRDFKTILGNSFTSRGASLDNLEFERIGRAFKAVYVTYGDTVCFASLRIIGRSSNDIIGFSGDGNLRVHVCGQSGIERRVLRTTALAFISELERDGRRLRTPNEPTPPYKIASAELFEIISKSGGQTSPTPSASKNGWQTRPIAIRWQGISDLVAGEISIKANNRAGTMKATIPGSSQTCEGTYQLGSDSTGSWALACTNGLTATGTFTAFGSDKGSSGNGKDSRGNAIQFTIGGR